MREKKIDREIEREREREREVREKKTAEKQFKMIGNFVVGQNKIKVT